MTPLESVQKEYQDNVEYWYYQRHYPSFDLRREDIRTRLRTLIVQLRALDSAIHSQKHSMNILLAHGDRCFKNGVEHERAAVIKYLNNTCWAPHYGNEIEAGDHLK